MHRKVGIRSIDEGNAVGLLVLCHLHCTLRTVISSILQHERVQQIPELLSRSSMQGVGPRIIYFEFCQVPLIINFYL